MIFGKHKEEFESLQDQVQNLLNEKEVCESKLQDAEKTAEKNLTYLDKLPTPVMAIDKDFNVQFMNSIGAQLLGRSQKDCQGMKCYDLFKTGHCNTGECRCSQAMQKGAISEFGDTVANLPSGALPIRYTGNALKDEQGNVIGAVEYVLNISDEVDITNGVLELAKSASAGRLDERADLSKFKGNYQEIVKGVNQTLDAVIGPLNVSAEYIDRISKGDIPEKITDEYHGDFNEIKNNLNMCIDAVNGLVDEAKMLTDAAVEGKLDVRGDAGKFHGDYQGLIKGFNNTLDAVIGPLNVSAEYIDRISKGDIPEKITDDYQGDFNEIKNNLNMCIDAVNGLVNESVLLSKAAVEGFLEKRGESDKFFGDYKKIINGMNQSIDAIVGHIDSIQTPVMVVDKEFNIRYLNKAGCGVVGKTQEEVIGNKCFNLFKTSDCNTGKCAVAQAMQKNTIVTETTDAHPNGLDLIIEYTGVPVKDNDGKIIGGLEVVFDKTEVSKAVEDAELKVEFLNKIPTPVMVIDKSYNIEYMNPAAAGAVGMTQQSVVGKKCYDFFKTGDCQNSKCALGRAMNEDKVITSDTVAQLPSGPLPIRYFGAPLKNASGETIGALEYVLDISKEMDVTNGIKTLAQAAEEGRLDERADTTKFEGNYKSIVEAVNKTIVNLVEPMKEAAEVMSKIADKDITARVTGDYKGQLEEFKNDINIAATNLDDAMQKIAASVEQVASASNEVAKGSQQLAEGSNEQASSIEEVSSSLEEMSSMTQQNSDNSNQAKTLADGAHKAAVEGKNNMDQMSEAILKIKESSDQTSKIVKTIDEIAFQTNLLALNAAVEAARAGEAGKGFAVVAEEVRNLAQRSAEAAKNTSQLIEESVENADQGVKITKVAADGLASIVESVKKTNDLISEIAAASKEQAVGIDQVSTAVQQMNKVTQDNASSSEESASAAEEMSSQAVSMQAMIDEFKLSKSGNRGHAPAMMQVPQRRVAPVMPRKRSQVIKPDEVIPLDDDDFDDF